MQELAIARRTEAIEFAFARDELHQVITWLTGYDEKKLEELIREKATFETFFQRATLHPNAPLITGVICGYRIEDIEDPLTRSPDEGLQLDQWHGPENSGSYGTMKIFLFEGSFAF